MSTIFTKIISGELPGHIPYQDDDVAVLITLEGHPIVIPKEEYVDIYELPEEIAAKIVVVAVKVAQALKSATGCPGINLVQSNGTIAGQEVFHFHLHVKPRFADDGMTITWDTATKPDEDRASLAQKIKQAL